MELSTCGIWNGSDKRKWVRVGMYKNIHNIVIKGGSWEKGDN